MPFCFYETPGGCKFADCPFCSFTGKRVSAKKFSMKKIFIVLIVSQLSPSLFAQTITIRDKTTLQPLAGVSLSAPALTVQTGSDGKADASVFRGIPEINLQLVGYQMVVLVTSVLEKGDTEVLLVEKINELQEVVVSANRFEEKRQNILPQIEIIKAKDIAFQNQPTSAEMLQNTGNVFVQKSQMGGGSPVLRGFEANKVLLVVDGVRMNNAIYRGGHLQNVITVDGNMLERTEIIFGPGSVLYGSDALGGVMHFYTRNPVFSNSPTQLTFKANAFARYASAYNEKTEHFDFSAGSANISYIAGFTFSDFGDLKQGKNRNDFIGELGKRNFYPERIGSQDVMTVNDKPEIQKFTGYRQWDFFNKLVIRPSNIVSHTLNLQSSNSTNVPRYDRLSETDNQGKLKTAEWYYGPQKRLFGSYCLLLGNQNPFYDQARLTLAYQNIEESRHNRDFGSNNLDHRIEKVDVYTANLDVEKRVGKQEFRYGGEAAFNRVNSTANRENILNKSTISWKTRYPDGGNRMNSLGLYATATQEIFPRLHVSYGIRYSYVYLNSLFRDKQFFPFPFDEVTQKNSSLTGSLGWVWTPSDVWRLSFNLASGFRAANVDDVTKVFDPPAGTLLVPNPDLKPEKTRNIDLNISRTFNRSITLSLTGFYTSYTDAIITLPFTFNGQASVMYDGSAKKVVASQNAQKAYVYGFNANLLADVNENLAFSGTFNYTYARIRGTDSSPETPLDHIPPTYGKISAMYKQQQFKGEFFMLYSDSKRLQDYSLSGEDNIQYAFADRGLPGWYTLNLRTLWQVNKFVQLQAAVENITDRNYRLFASGISAPGRNFVITLRGSI
jgi:hemoglobin/transferrin/lactoferrin receptor protein